MFERFTQQARIVLVQAQDEARALRHGQIGAEHLLLGILHAEGSQAALALAGLGIDLAGALAGAVQVSGPGLASPGADLAFTPEAKKAIASSLRESLRLRHDFIGPEHPLLALAAERDSAAVRVLGTLGVPPFFVRDELAAAGFAGVPPRPSGQAGSLLSRLRSRRP